MVAFPGPRSSHPYHMHDMIRGQPAYVEETLKRVRGTSFASQVDSSDHLIVTGCGTSFHAAWYGARVLGAALGPRAHVESVQAYDLLAGPPVPRGAAVLGVSHSGSTPTTNRALSRARRSGAKVLGVCGLPDTSMSAVAESTLVTGSTHDRSWANTMSYATQLVAFASLAADLGGLSWRPIRQGLARLPDAIGVALKCELTVRQLARAVASRERVTFLASGLDEITALEGALKIRETCSLPASGYHIEQFLHGPFLSLDRKDSIIALVSREDGERMDAILAGFARTGASVARVGDGRGARILLPAVHRVLRPIISVVPLQFLAYYAAIVRKANPDIMRTDLARYQAALELLFS